MLLEAEVWMSAIYQELHWLNPQHILQSITLILQMCKTEAQRG